MNKKTFLAFTIALASSLVVSQTLAAVSAEEAAKLSSSLTPLGGERAGNADGSIPAWSGGTPQAASSGPNDIPSDLFAGDKPLLKITAANMAKYSDKLSEGTRALLEKYPDSFHLDVYPTRRTASAPEYVYQNTARNAQNCKLVQDGKSVEGCFGGIPFPIPQSGQEVIWNYLLRVEPEAMEYGFKNIVITSDGEQTLATRNDNYWQYPYYYKKGSLDNWSQEYFLQRFSTTAPSFKSGETLVIRDSVNPKQARQAWQYLVGQRRVRRAPTVAYDTPDFVASGANYFDEVQGFFGMPDRYEWKVIGKQETYIPYNANGQVTANVEDAFSAHHLNPDKLRWELHRTWVVEANLASGKRHAVPKRKFYFDEDTWLLTLMDGYDAEGKLWRTSQVLPFVVPSVPAVLVKPVAVYNLQAGTVSNVQALNGEIFRIVPLKPESFFTGDAVAAEGVR
ncbi:DUF1329 domain-containing protein [Ectopseudomonas oleovorans]|uniref:DUF1329 domain-containing protein n=1 Tax=Ectopseudomonas oleovorans TaxID=301 RepID=UPI000CF0D67F|nr:DUF1329 domain-containing protein [Pseudomonas oleovorans]PPV39467.1 DUF1329 domain-containing protein [Pseudomonas oleovorans]